MRRFEMKPYQYLQQSEQAVRGYRPQPVPVSVPEVVGTHCVVGTHFVSDVMTKAECENFIKDMGEGRIVSAEEGRRLKRQMVDPW